MKDRFQKMVVFLQGRFGSGLELTDAVGAGHW